MPVLPPAKCLAVRINPALCHHQGLQIRLILPG
jgi:hypothetical protein